MVLEKILLVSLLEQSVEPYDHQRYPPVPAILLLCVT